MKTTIKNISGWGNYPVVKATVIRPDSVEELLQIVKETPSLLARGNGRSYGDSSLHHTVVDITGLNKILNETDNTIEVQCGITIEELLVHIVPQKKFLAVTPGIKSITIGGAIASDVHGKNHLHEGSFFNITQSLQLINDGGNLVNCSRNQNQELFLKVFGSMGLHGIIVSATIKLMDIETTWFGENQFVADSFEEIFQLMEKHRLAPFMVSWLDLLNKQTRGVVKTGNWMDINALPKDKVPVTLNVGQTKSIPFTFLFAPPAWVFKWYNKKYFATAKQKTSSSLHFNDFFYPLDKIKNWNRIFGPKGLLQYHFVLPLVSSKTGMEHVISRVKKSNAICTLAVMKRFGKGNAETPHSFPIEGYHMALDFINNKKAIAMIGELDIYIKSLGGKVYKTKDAVSSLPKPIVSSSKFDSLQNKRYAS